MNYATIATSTLIVENVVVWDGLPPWHPPDGCIAVEIPDGSPAGIGWSYINGQFVPPPEPEPVPPSTDSQFITQEV